MNTVIEFWQYEKEEGTGTFVKGATQCGKFHQFGCNFEEFEDGPGNYTTCIIEKDDGQLVNIPVDQCRLIND